MREKLLACYWEFLWSQQNIPESSWCLWPKPSNASLVDLRGQNVNDVQKMENIFESIHDPSDHLRAILLALNCVEVILEFQSGWQFVIPDPSDAFILFHSQKQCPSLKNNVLLKPSFHSFDKRGEDHAEAINHVIGLAS